MPPGSPTCTIPSTFFTFYPTQGGKYRFRVSVRENNKLPKRSAVFSKTKRAQVALNSLDRIEVTVHKAFEQHMTTQTNDHDLYNNTIEKVHQKPDAWGLDGDVERGM